MAARKPTRRKNTAPRASRAGGNPTQVISPRGEKLLERVRAICMALPEATEKQAWGAPTFRVRDKLFCHFHDNHHGDGRIAIWCKAPPGDQELLVNSRPKLFFVPPYVGKSGWVGMLLTRPNWSLASELLSNGYRMNAPKRQLALLDELET